MEKEEIIDICQKTEKKFKKIIKNISYEKKGIFNSEMLMFVSIVESLGIKNIIESGRARGQSTKVICEFFNNPNYKIDSIEYYKYNKDAIIAMRRLHQYKNLNLHFGDALGLIPKILKNECCILLDGPKGDKALKLAASLFKNPFVRAVFIHDVHKDSPHRMVMENLFNYTFFSDDEDFIKRFKYLDKDCWIKQARYKKARDWEPYKRGQKKMQSYSSTLGAVFNNKSGINTQFYKEYFGNKRSNKIRKRIVTGAVHKICRSAAIPVWFILYYLNKFYFKNIRNKYE